MGERGGFLNKISSLDSIRGIAALMVVIYHFTSAFLPRVVGEPLTPVHTNYDDLVHKTPLSLVLAGGTMAVTMFFVLSGFVLTYKFYQGRQKSLFSSAIKRYFRLMPVALFSVLFGFFLIKLGLMHFKEAGEITGSAWLRQTFFMFDPSLMDAIKQGTIGIFVFPSNVINFAPLNPVLWTIYYELIGSILVFSLASLVKNHKKRWALYLISVIGFLNTFFVGFIVGAIMADIYANAPSLVNKIKNLKLFYKISFLMTALLLAGYPNQGDLGKYWGALTLFDSSQLASAQVTQLVSAIIIITLALCWVRFERILGIKPLLFLGKISYGLYAVHFLIIFSLTSWLFVWLNRNFGYLESVLAASVISLPFMIVLAWLVHKYIEIPSLGLANKVSKWSKD